MAYSADYTPTDVPNIAFDFVGNIGVEAIAFAGAIVGVAVLLWLLRSMSKGKKIGGKLI